MAPIVKMHTLGHDFIPEPIHAGGLRYHGMSPLVSLLKEHGLIEAQQRPPARQLRGGRPVRPGRGHPAGARADPRHQRRDRRGARRAKEAGEPKVILFNLCGHGHFDLAAYERYLAGSLEDYEYPLEAVNAALAGLPTV